MLNEDRNRVLKLKKVTKRKISNGEWYILEFIWEKTPQMISTVADYMKNEVGWAKSTTITTINRMEKKGLIRFRRFANAKLLYPNIGREEIEKSELDDLVIRVYHGETQKLIRQLRKYYNVPEA